MQLYTFAGTVASDVNVLDAGNLSGVIVPIGIRAKVAGQATLSISGVTAFSAADNIWLVDNKEGTRTSLLEREIFEFDLAAGTTDDRFFLHFEQTPRVDPGDKTNITGTDVIADAIYVNVTGHTLNVLSKVEPMEGITIYDVSSRIVYQASGLNTNYFSCRLPETTAVYMIKIVTSKKTVTQKVIVK